MIEISSQMREFVNFAQDAVANNAKNTIARLGKRDSIFFAFQIGAAADGDSVGKLRRSGASKKATIPCAPSSARPSPRCSAARTTSRRTSWPR